MAHHIFTIVNMTIIQTDRNKFTIWNGDQVHSKDLSLDLIRIHASALVDQSVRATIARIK